MHQTLQSHYKVHQQSLYNCGGVIGLLCSPFVANIATWITLLVNGACHAIYQQRDLMRKSAQIPCTPLAKTTATGVHTTNLKCKHAIAGRLACFGCLLLSVGSHADISNSNHDNKPNETQQTRQAKTEASGTLKNKQKHCTCRW